MGKHPDRPKKKNEKRRWGKPRMAYDFTVLFVVPILVLFGVLMIFSSSYYYTMTTAKYGLDMFYFLKKQSIWAVLGFGAMGVAMVIPYKTWWNFAGMAYWVSNIFLALLPVIGIEVNGQKRWLGVGPLQFQPSEFTKIAVIWYLSFYLIKHKEELKTPKGFAKACCVLLLPVGLIAVSNFSSAILVGLIGASILFIACPNIKFLFYPVAIAAPLCAAALFLPQFAYRLGRIRIWKDPWSDPTGDGFQIIQSLYAVASGGLFGLGLGKSRQKTFIPEAYNDIIFAIICEELGILGAGLVIFLFAVLIWRGIKIAVYAKDTFGRYVATGITATIAFQSIINIGVVTNTIPNTGQPLPFISYGGTSLVFLMGMVGMLLNISTYPKDSE